MTRRILVRDDTLCNSDRHGGMMHSEELIREINTSIIRWYPFSGGTSCIYVGEEDAVYSYLKEKFDSRMCRYICPENMGDSFAIELKEGKKNSKADYIISIAYPERVGNPTALFSWAKEHLLSNGRLILGMNNRLGIKYFCGDCDPHTLQCFDGIDGYFRAYKSPEDKFVGRSYDKNQLSHMLEKAGFNDAKYYSVFSDLDNASFLFADGYIPNEELGIRIYPTYNRPDTVFLEEEILYSSLLDNGMFHGMANAFLIECALNGKHSDALQVTCSLDRGHKDARITIIHENDTVTKQAPFEEGIEGLRLLDENIQCLKNRGVSVVEGALNGDTYTMPLIHAETGMVYLQRLYESNQELFLQKLDEFRDEILRSSDAYDDVYKFPDLESESEIDRKKRIYGKKEPWEQESMRLLKEGYVDMIPLNTFYIDGKFIFYDQEFCFRDYPVNAIMRRVIGSLMATVPSQGGISLKDLYFRYGINMDDTGRFNYVTRIADAWLDDVKKETRLANYYKRIRRNYSTIYANRQRMNFSVDDYQKLFVDVFDKADSRKLILFGSGAYARQFMAIYGDDYDIYAVVDNNENKWGQRLYPEGYSEGSTDAGVEIHSPAILSDLHQGEYKVIICIKSFFSVMRQLDVMGVTEYSVYDPGKPYPRKRHPLTAEAAEHFNNSTVTVEGGRKYHVGYIAGVFDLYHIGHLNMFRRAKEMCDYLIVGVVSDEGVKHIKRTDPFVPFDERIEMVKSCRYVDEAVEIPYMFNGTEDAWKMHHFDVQFSGTDYINDPVFLKYKEFLENHGATMEFFPYTESTSSTKLKKLIEKKLL